MTVAEMLARMSSRELAEWMALYKIESEEQGGAAEDPEKVLARRAEAKLNARKKRR